MKLKIKLLFDKKSKIHLTTIDQSLININITLTDDFFDNVQIAKQLCNKFILSNIFDNLKTIELSVSDLNQNHKTDAALMLHNVLNIASKQRLSNVDFNTIGLEQFQDTVDNKLFTQLLDQYIKMLFTTSNTMNPVTWSKYIIDTCKSMITDKGKHCLVKEIIADPKQLPLIHSVGKGSQFSPRLIVCGFGVSTEDELKNQKFNYCFIGKGVTFDTGGYCIKGGIHMLDMSIDKSGSVLGFFTALYNYLAFDIKTVFVTPIVENCVSNNAYFPGEIITSALGVKVNIKNTDAEGRLILADAIEYAVSNFRFKYCFQFATLTGAAAVCVGSGRTVFLTKDNDLNNDIVATHLISGEQVHRLPNDKYFLNSFKSNIRHQDVIDNLGVEREAGTIIAGMFTEHFYDNAHSKLNKLNKPSFCHFDIAPLITLDYFKNNISYSYNLLFISKLCRFQNGKI
jgi:leucyl aminopeptidase